MNKLILPFIFVAFSAITFCVEANNEKEKEKNWGISFSGFVKSDYWYDSRQVVASREDLFLFYPAGKDIDKQGNDINASPGFNYSAITSRLTGEIKTPSAFGAETSGIIEADFSGVTNESINTFRLRHAYGKMRWDNSEILFGQFWHPMFVVEVFPNVISLNTGAPFQPFIRNPQISYTHFYENFNINLTLLSQRDNSSDGPLGFDNSYMRNTLVPNVHIQLQYKGDNHVLGAAGDYKVLRPRLATDSFEKTNSYTRDEEKPVKTNETIDSYSVMGYWKYSDKNFTWQCKGIFGQNLTEHLLLGGYAIKKDDHETGIEKYTPTNHFFAWGNVIYGTNIRVGLFGGFAKNLGTSHNNTGEYFARGKNIDYLYRMAPSISFISGPVQISTELEYTAAAYGDADSKGRVKNSSEVTNVRGLLTIFYFF